MPKRAFELSITVVEDTPKRAVIALGGELCLSNAVELRHQLFGSRSSESVTERSSTVVLDLAELVSMDAAGLGIIVGLLRRFAGRGIQNAVTVRNPNEEVYKALQVCGLLRLVKIERTNGDKVTVVPDPSVAAKGSAEC